MGAPINSEHYKKWAMTIGEWNLHAKLLPIHMGKKESGVHPLIQVCAEELRSIPTFSTVQGCGMRNVTTSSPSSENKGYML